MAERFTGSVAVRRLVHDVIAVITQRLSTPLIQQIPLMTYVQVNDRLAGYVTGVYAPPKDGIGGVVIEVTCDSD